jgi:hypothetical protein
MKDFSKIARVRSIKERQARSELGQSIKREGEARRVEAAAADAHRQALEQTGAADARSLVVQSLAQKATAERTTLASASRAWAEHNTQSARGSWQRAAQDLDVAEELEERRLIDLATKARRSSDMVLDEMMTIRRHVR